MTQDMVTDKRNRYKGRNDDWFPSSLMVTDITGDSEVGLISCTGDIVTWEQVEHMIEFIKPFYEKYTDKSIVDCNAKHQYSDEEVAQYRKQAPKGKPRPVSGYVYLIRLGDTGYYKIGKAKNPSDRIKQFSPVFPEEPVIVCLIKSKDYTALERRLHKRYSYCRAKGEWFRLDEDDVEYIKGLANE